MKDKDEQGRRRSEKNIEEMRKKKVKQEDK